MKKRLIIRIISIVLVALMLLASGCVALPSTSQSPSAPTPDKTADVVADGGLQLKLEQTTYNYDGNNITALRVTSTSGKPCDVVMVASYVDENGSVIKKETKTFNGFPAKYSNYFLFVPEIFYADVLFDVTATECGSASDAQYLTIGTKAKIEKMPEALMFVDQNNKVTFPTSPEHMATLKRAVVLSLSIEGMKVTNANTFRYTGYTVIIDSNGNIPYIERDSCEIGNYTGAEFAANVLYSPGVFGDDIKNYKLPNEYKNVTGFFALESFEKLN